MNFLVLSFYKNIRREQKTRSTLPTTFQDPSIKPVAILRRQIFVIRILGLSSDSPTTVHIEKSDTTVRCVIQSVIFA
jgi:hypothetical protein